MENLQDDVIEILRTAPAVIKVYEGIGFIEDDNKAHYYASLDPDTEGAYSFTIFKIKNKGFLIHLDNGSTFELKNPTNNIYQIDFDPQKKVFNPKKYDIVLYHSTNKVTKKDADEIFKNNTSKSITAKIMEPNKTGTGTIRT